MERHDEQFLKIHPQSNRIIIADDVGAASLAIVSKISSLFDSDKMSYVQIEQGVTQVCNEFVGSSCSELMIVKKNYLKILGPRQLTKKFPLTEDSLQSYSIIHQQHYIVENPKTSSFYNSFKRQLAYFSPLSNTQIDSTNLACVPIIDREGTPIAVITLFDKVNETSNQSIFNNNDINIVKAIGAMLVQILQVRSQFNAMDQRIQSIRSANQESEQMIEVSNNIIRRKKLAEKIARVLSKDGQVSKDLLLIIPQVMNSDAMICHFYTEGRLVPCYAENIKYDQISDLVTRTSEYSALHEKGLMNFPDLQSEPLWNLDKRIKMQSLLSLPVIAVDGTLIGVIELFRKNSIFTGLDERIGQKLMRALGKASIDSFQIVYTQFTGKIVKQLNLTNIVDAKVGNLNRFFLNDSDYFDYTSFLEQAAESIQHLINYDKCSIYFVDQKSKIMWTRKSEQCEELTVAVSPNNILGYSCINVQPVLLPSADDLGIKDIQIYDGQHVLVYPIISWQFFEPVIGVILLQRSAEAFKQVEINSLEKFTKSLQFCLENLFNNSMTTKEALIDFSPSTSNFRQLNVERSIFKSSSNLTVSNSYDNNITQLIPTENINEDNNPIRKLANLTAFSNNRIVELKQILGDLVDDPREALQILADRLNLLIPCERARLLLLDKTQDNLIDPATGSVFRMQGLTKKCFETCQVIIHQASAWQQPDFDRFSDSLGTDRTIDSYLAIPIVQSQNTVSGVMVFVNASLSFGEDDIAFGEFLSLIPREYVTLQRISGSQSIKSIIREGRRYKMLQYWYKQIFIVANSTQNKDIIARDILYNLSSNTDLDTLIINCLQIICQLTNTESCSVLYQEINTVMAYTSNGKERKVFQQWEENLFRRILREQRPIFVDNIPQAENLIMIPFFSTDGNYCIIQATNKRDDTLALYSNFTREDETWIGEFAKAIFMALFPTEENDPRDIIKRVIRKQASNINTYSLIKTIRNAAQRLLDCDRATVFIRDGDHLIVRAQGMEQEIPVNLKIPVGVGIVGNVAQTGQTENITDVYNDPRFNTNIDKETGYRTRSMLCMPVINSNGEVIAALQMINKKSGPFDVEDEQTLEIFCDMVATMLQNWTTVSKVIEERTKLLKIFDSIGNFIITLDKQGKLAYCNKSFETVFGIPQKIAQEKHYSNWLRANKELTYDITEVFLKRLTKRQKNNATIFKIPQQKSTTYLTNLKNITRLHLEQVKYNYTVASLHEFEAKQIAGVVIILEDATYIHKMSQKFKEMQSKLKQLTNPVVLETGLQQCIKNLNEITDKIDSNSEIYHEMRQVLASLRSGNLLLPQIQLPQAIALDNDVRNVLNLCGGDVMIKDERTNLNASQTINQPLTPVNVKVELDVDQEVLRDWNLNAFQIDNHMAYIKSMLQDFELIDRFSIPESKLTNFVQTIRKLYSTHNNPFHNFFHGFSVMHSTYIILATTRATELYEVHDMLALLIASLCHDVQHTGRTNIFEVNKESLLSIIYNDKSVLENHHCAMTFKTLSDERCNIFSNIEPDLRKAIRKLMIVAILGTDMAKHFGIISSCENRLRNIHEEPLGSLETDKDFFTEMLVHAADLAHPTKTYNVYAIWSERVCQEFTAQYYDEIRQDLPPSNFMKDLDVPKVYLNNEINFLKFVVKPLWVTMTSWLQPNLNFAGENADENILMFAERLENLPLEEE